MNIEDCLISAEEMWAECERKEKEWLSLPKPNYGKVFWNRKDGTIELQVYGKNSYEIDLETCNTKAELLNWIFHISEKNWSHEIMADLIKMFRYVIPDRILFK